MPLQKDQILTPDKKNIVVENILMEIASIDNAIKEGKLGQEIVNKLRKNKEALQTVLNSVFTKKGVITPNETNQILTSLDDSKRARLEKSFFKSTRTAVLLLVGFIVIGGVFVYLSKKNKQ